VSLEDEDDGKIPPDLPDPSRMTRKELEAEVFGGRLAYASIVQEAREWQRRCVELEQEIKRANRNTLHLSRMLWSGPWSEK